MGSGSEEGESNHTWRGVLGQVELSTSSVIRVGKLQSTAESSLLPIFANVLLEHSPTYARMAGSTIWP